MSQTNSENTITVQELIEELEKHPKDAEVIFGDVNSLHFSRVKERGHDQVQIEFNEQVYRDSEGLLVVQDLE